MKAKVRAFTLNEMVIVMVISVIIIGLAFTVLTLVKRHIWSIERNFNLNTQYNQLEQSLWIDTNRYNSIVYDDNQSSLKFKSAIDSTVYKFHSDYILKDIDTFKISIAKKTLFFNGNEVVKGKVDAVRLELSEKIEDLRLFIFKQNDATQFIN